MSELCGRRTLVTGGSGFIASHLTRRLVADGAEVAILTKYCSVIENTRLADVWDRVRVIEADLRNDDSLRQVADFRPEVVFHLAAYNHVGDSFTHVSESLDCNAKGTARVLEAWEGYDRFVYVATSEVYGLQQDVPFHEEMTPAPLSPYAVGKYAGELYARMKHHATGKPIAVVRPFNAYGPFQSPRAIIAEMCLTCLRGQPVRSTEGRQTREFNFVDNLVDGLLLAAVRPEAVGQVINLGCGREIAIRDLIHMVHQATSSSSELRIGELPYRPTEIWRMFADNRKAKRLLGWEPRVDFEEGLRRTVAWYRGYRDLFDRPESPLWRLCRHE